MKLFHFLFAKNVFGGYYQQHRKLNAEEREERKVLCDAKAEETKALFPIENGSWVCPDQGLGGSKIRCHPTCDKGTAPDWTDESISKPKKDGKGFMVRCGDPPTIVRKNLPLDTDLSCSELPTHPCIAEADNTRIECGALHLLDGEVINDRRADFQVVCDDGIVAGNVHCFDGQFNAPAWNKDDWKNSCKPVRESEFGLLIMHNRTDYDVQATDAGWMYNSQQTIISEDGSKISTPIIGNSYETRFSVFALIKNELYVFGNFYQPLLQDTYQIGKLNGCSIEYLPLKLSFDPSYVSAALPIDNDTKALICFGFQAAKSCDIFDTENVVSTFSTQFDHLYGKLGHYNGKPTSVGHQTPTNNAWGKVEVLNEDGWTLLNEHPRLISQHTLIGLESGALILAGGVYYEDLIDYNIVTSKEVWLLSEDEWSLVGELREPNVVGSAIRVGNFIYIAPGYEPWTGYEGDYQFPVERLEIEDDQLLETQIILEFGNSTYDSSNPIPVMFATTLDLCDNTCGNRLSYL